MEGKGLRALDFLTLEGYSKEVDVEKYYALLDKKAEDRISTLTAVATEAVYCLKKRLKLDEMCEREMLKLLILCGYSLEKLTVLLRVLVQSEKREVTEEGKLIVNLGSLERPLRELVETNKSVLGRAVVLALFNAYAAKTKFDEPRLNLLT